MVKIKKNKRGFEMDMLGWWIIGLIALVILVLAVMYLRGDGANAIAYIADLFRFKSTG